MEQQLDYERSKVAMTIASLNMNLLLHFFKNSVNYGHIQLKAWRKDSLLVLKTAKVRRDDKIGILNMISQVQSCWNPETLQ